MRVSSLHICALIPTYNNANTIVDVIRRTYKYLKNIIVVVDGCTDNTLDLLNNLEIPITLVSYLKNKGKGYALKCGFKKALSMGFEYALTIDSDGQHYPEDIPLLVNALKKHPGALVIGSRKLVSENVPGTNKFANKFSNFWFHIQTHVKLPDTQTGFRIYPLKKLYGLSIMTSRYEAELELLVFAAWHNVPLLPVDIRVYYPPKEERISHFRPALDFTRISILNVFLCIGALLYGYPMMYWSMVYSFGLWGPLMLIFIQPLSLFYFLLFGKTDKSKLRYRTFMAKFAGWCIKHIPGLETSVNNPYQHTIGAKPTLYICNHQSVLDIILIFSLTSRLIVLTKEWVWRNPVLGIILRLSDCLPITYGNEVNLERMRDMVNRGYSIMIFPEGTRTPNGDIVRFHRGAFYIADQLSLDICPLLIRGMYSVLSKNEFRIRPSKVILDVLPIIRVNDKSFGDNFKKRTVNIEKYYANILDKRFDDTIGIIGAGVGGLFTAALLAEKGYQVTVLEQAPYYGGGLSSFQRYGVNWQIATHVVCGLNEDQLIGSILKRLNINIDFEESTFDNLPTELIGKHEIAYFQQGFARLIGGAKPLVDELATYIVRHGGRILCNECVEEIAVEDNRVTAVRTQHNQYVFANVISTIHPKQLISLTNQPVFRKVTTNRILSTQESFGTFKLYILLKENMLQHDKITHYIPEKRLLVFTPPHTKSATYARTIECIMPISNQELTQWQQDRSADYQQYQAYKDQQSAMIIDCISQIYPTIKECISEYFSATSLTYRDEYLTPEGAMFGMQESVGGVSTKVSNLYIGGQNCYLHGIYGTIMTALETIKYLDQDEA